MKGKYVKAFKWSIIQQFLTQILNYGSILFLAYLVDPGYHGLITLASLPALLINSVGSLGIRELLTTQKEITNEEKQGYLSFVLFLGFLLFLLSSILSILTAFFYENQYSFYDFMKLGIIISIISPLSVINNYFEAFQSRELNFKGLGIITIISISIGSVISVIFAYFGFYIAALIIKLVLPHFLIFLLYLLFFKPSLALKWTPEIYLKIKSYSLFYTLNSILNYFVRNIDNIIIGKAFSPEILGQYSIAYKILLFPMKNISSRIHAVSMPILSKMDYNSVEFRNRFFMIMGFISLVTLPIMGLLAITANDWVKLTFNNKYTHIVEMIQILSIVGAFQSILSPIGSLYLIKKETKLMFFNSLISSIIVSLVFIVSSFSGDISLVLISYAFSWILIIQLITIYPIFKIYKISILIYFKTILPSIVSTIFSVLLCMVFQFFFTNSIAWISIIIQFFIFISTFFVLFHLFTKKATLNYKTYLTLFNK